MPIKVITPKNKTLVTKEKYSSVKEEGITIDNDAFSATLADVENILIDNRNQSKLLIHLFNNGGTNSFDFEVSGHAEELDAPPALAVAPTEWFVLPNGTGALANNASIALCITDNWAWIAIRLRRTITALDSIADVFIRALQ